MKKSGLLAVLALITLTVRPALAQPFKVFVSIGPQKYFVEKIGRDLVDVEVMVQPGASPHTYEPRPRQMVGLAQAGIYFAVGVGFEDTWLKRIKAAHPRMRVVHTEKGIKKRAMKAHEQEREHSGGKDPHVWTAPPLVKIQAGNILGGLISVDPAHQSVYQDNYNEFIKELDALDARLREVFAKKEKGLEFMVYHPAWGYLADAYGLRQVPVEIEGKSPTPGQLKKLIERAGKRGIKVVFVQPQFSAKSAKLIARAIGGEVAFADPLAEDWAENLKHVAARFEAALR